MTLSENSGHLGTHTVPRVGFGAMQLEHGTADNASAVLRRVVELGVRHIDTASFYGPDAQVNTRIADALAPYADDLVLVSKVGAIHIGGDGVPLQLAQKPENLREQVETDLRSLKVDQVPVVNLRRADAGPGLVAEGDQIVDLDDQLAELTSLRDRGLIGAIGMSNISLEQFRHATESGVDVVCVQNAYSVLDRTSQPLLDAVREHGAAWVPYFPLGSAFPGMPKVSDDPVVTRIAAELSVSPAQVALAWLLATYDNTLLIPGTSNVAHVDDNLAVASVTLPGDAIAELDALGS